MKLFGPIYTKMLQWAEHKNASKYLAALSLAESSFFPIPVDIMLAPMVLAKPQRWWRLALLTTIMSVIGGVIGYFIGAYALEWVTPILKKYHYWDRFLQIKTWFDEWGIWVIFVAGFSPVPYKIFTIAAGAFGMALGPFVAMSLAARAARFFLVAYVVKLSAGKIKSLDLQWIERIGWMMVGVLILIIGIKWIS